MSFKFSSLFRTLLLALVLVAGPLAAQDTPEIDYDRWEGFAAQAEDALAHSETSSEVLSSIRDNAVKWRDRFSQAKDANAPRIQTLRDQLAALGPPPAEGETEAEDVANRRKELNARLSELQAPGLAATEALSRANSLVGQVDQLERKRDAEVILTLSPSPLLPSSWIAAGRDVIEVVKGFASEADREFRRENLMNRAPEVLAYLLGALGLLIFGPRFVDSLPAKLGSRSDKERRPVIAFVVSLGQIVVPMTGITLLAWAVDATGLVGRWGTPFLLALPVAALIFWSGRWLVRTLFAEVPVAYATLNLPTEARAKARIFGSGLVVMMALHSYLGHAALPQSGYVRSENALPRIPYDISAAGAGVFHLFLLTGGAFFLFRLSSILRRMNRYEAGDSPPYRSRALTVAGTVLRLLAPLAVIAAVLGYVNLGNAMLWPAAKSLGMIGLLILLQDFIADLYALLNRSQKDARDSLAPMLIGFILILASAPVFALIWGSSVAELAEWRVRFMQGISFGGVRLSPRGVMVFLIVFSLGYLATGWVKSAFRNSILPRTNLDKGAQTAAVSGLGYVGIFLAALLAITSAGIDLSSLAIVAGALSVGIGFGLQTIVQNFVSGIILLIERPVSVGDWIEAGGQQGIVSDISVRSTRIRTFDQTDVIVPNSDLITQTVTNWTRGNSRGRIIVPVGVAYDSDTRKVERLLREIVEDQPTVLFDPAPAVLFMGLGASSLDFEIRAILSDIGGGLGVSSEIRHQILKRFAEEGIELPFPQRDLWLRNPETLRGDAAPAEHAGPPEPPEPAEAPSGEVADVHSAGALPDGASDGGDGDNS